MTKKRILIVEDDAVNISLLSGLLRDNFSISIARTKARALEIIAKELIHIILLDLNLPDGSGFDICDAVKAEGDFLKVPLVVVMTGSSDEQTELESFSRGANEFITKPINKDIFLARLSLQSSIVDAIQSNTK
jgi:putative two-component system response regulator